MTVDHGGREPDEAPQQPEPRIYVASLSDYNAGRLHGQWVTADPDPSVMTDAVQTMLAASPEPHAEEYAIHDHEGFWPLQLSEYESIDTIAGLAAKIQAFGTAVLHLAAELDRGDWDYLDRFDELYLGHWSSTTEYAEQMLDDHGIDLDHYEPAWLRPYVTIDTATLGRDLSAELITSHGREGGVHIFEQP